MAISRSPLAPSRWFRRGPPVAVLGALLFASACSEAREPAADEQIIVSGASGQLGALVVEELLGRGVDPRNLILVSRTPEALDEYASIGAITRYGDFEHPETLDAAYEGGTKMLLISMNPHPERVRLHQGAIDAARAAGVRHVAYVSSVDVDNPDSRSASEHRATEEHLRASGMEWTMLRNHLYADGLVNQAARMVADGRVVIQPDEVPTAYVARADCAAVAAAVLATPGHEGRAYAITGSELVLRRDVATLAAELTGRPVELVPGEGGQPQVASVMAGFRSFGVRTDAVRELTGRPATTLRQLFELNRDRLLSGGS